MALPLFVVYAILDRDLRAEGMPSRNWSVIDCDDLDGLYATVYEESATPITLPIRVRSRQSQLVILGSTRRR